MTDKQTDKQTDKIQIEEKADWECLICGEEVADGELCKCLRDYREEKK